VTKGQGRQSWQPLLIRGLARSYSPVPIPAFQPTVPGSALSRSPTWARRQIGWIVTARLPSIRLARWFLGGRFDRDEDYLMGTCPLGRLQVKPGSNSSMERQLSGNAHGFIHFSRCRIPGYFAS